MFRTLLESNARRPRRRAGLMASVAVHTVVIGGALAATAAARSHEGVDPGPPIPKVIYTYPPPTPTPQPQRPSLDERFRRSGVHSAALIPADVGTRLYFRADSLLPRAHDIEIGTMGPIDSGSLCLGHCGEHRGRDSTSDPGPMLATLATVDRPAAVLMAPRPRYPEQLRAAGVTGRVVVRLVVDTLGRVEPASVIIRESSHDLFTNAV